MGVANRFEGHSHVSLAVSCAQFFPPLERLDPKNSIPMTYPCKDLISLFNHLGIFTRKLQPISYVSRISVFRRPWYGFFSDRILDVSQAGEELSV